MQDKTPDRVSGVFVKNQKNQLDNQLENTYIVDEKGNKTKVTRKGKK